MAAVALYDSAYDGLGVAPIQQNQYPSLTAGAQVNRKLILYNDEFVDSTVTATVEIRTGGTTRATGSRDYNLALGTHTVLPYSFQVPYVGGSTMDLVLTTRKGGVDKFAETKRFNVTGGTTGTSSTAVTLGDATFARRDGRPGRLGGDTWQIFSVNVGQREVLRLPLRGSGLAGPATASVYDLEGKLLCLLPAVVRENGSIVAHLTTDRAPLSQGRYVVRVKAGEADLMHVFSVVR